MLIQGTGAYPMHKSVNGALGPMGFRAFGAMGDLGLSMFWSLGQTSLRTVGTKESFKALGHMAYRWDSAHLEYFAILFHTI